MMQLQDMPSYVSSFGKYCIPVDILSLRCFSIVTTIILFLRLAWILYQKIMKKSNITQIANTNAFNELHRATFENDVIASYRIIRKHPAVINIPHAVDGYTPFMRACLNGNTQLVRLMLTHGAEIANTSSKGETPFYLGVFHHIRNPQIKDASCIHTLYYAGADVNAANSKGYTPIHLAAMFGHTQLAQWLLNKGARITVQPDPYVLARLQGHYETARLLQHRRVPAIQ